MNFGEWTEHCHDDLKDAGFLTLKPHRFGRVRGGVLQIIDFQGRKSDVYIWRNAVPLSLPELQLGMGCPPASGRFPRSPNELTAETDEATETAKLALRQILVNSVFPELEKVSSLDSLDSQLALSEMTNFAFFFRGFCLLQAGEARAGQAMLKAPSGKPYPVNWRKHVEHFASLPLKEIQPQIQSFIEKNTERLRLGKLLR